MNKTLKAALATFVAIGASQAAQAQVMGSPDTTVTGGTVYVEERDVFYTMPSHHGLNINGAVGLPLNPTAQIPGTGGVRVQANYYDLWDAGPADAKLYGLYAATRMGDAPLEISGGIEKMDAGNDVFDIDRTGFALGAKYLFSPETENALDARFAVGAGYSHSLYRNLHAYAVGSKVFNVADRGVTGHLGVRWDRFRILGESSSRPSIFAGAEVPIDSRGRFHLVGELQSKNADSDFGGKAPYSLSLRYQNGTGFAASAGIHRQGVLADFTDGGSRLFAQVGQTF